MSKITWALLVLSLVACQEEPVDCCTTIDTYIDLSVVDSSGADRLNPDHPRAFRLSDIRTFYQEEEAPHYLQRPELFPPDENASGLQQQEYVLRIFPYDGSTEEYPTTYLEWRNTDVDTLQCAFDRVGGIVGTRVWFNGELVWDTSSPTIRSFQIVK